MLNDILLIIISPIYLCNCFSVQTLNKLIFGNITDMLYPGIYFKSVPTAPISI